MKPLFFLFRHSKYAHLYFLIFILIFLGAFGIKYQNVSASTLVKSLDLSSVQAVSNYMLSNYSCTLGATSYAYNTKVYATSSAGLSGATSTIITAISFMPVNVIRVDKIGEYLQFTPSVGNTGVQIAIYRSTNWNYGGGASEKATSTTQILVGLSSVVSASMSTTTETVFSFTNPIYLQPNYHYFIIPLNYSNPQNQYPATTAIPSLYTLNINTPDMGGGNCDYYGLLSGYFASVYAISSSTQAGTYDGMNLHTGYFSYMPFGLSGSAVNVDITSSGHNATFLPFNLYAVSNDVAGCGDQTALNYNPLANIDDGSCYYSLPTATASSTRITDLSYSTSSNTINVGYNIKIGDSVYIYFENKNDRDGIIQSSYFSPVASPLLASTTQPTPLSGSGYTTLTAKLVNKFDFSKIYDTKQIIIDLATGLQIVATQTYQEQPCGIANLTGCMANALAGAFYPTQDSINSYYNFIALIQTKAPVGYFTIVKNNLNNLATSSTPVFTISIPIHFKNYFFDPFDIAIASILWFFFAINFYKRLKTITI